MKRPLKFKLDAWRFYSEGHTPLEAFVLAGKENDVPLSGCMTTKAYASGYMSDDIKNFLRRKRIQGNPEIDAYLVTWKLTL